MAKVYIAGKVKDLPIEEVKRKFVNATIELDNEGHVAVNPVLFIETHNDLLVKSGGMTLSDDDPKQRREILKICISLLMDCDYIYLLHDWQESEGATFEKQVADMFGIKVYNVG